MVFQIFSTKKNLSHEYSLPEFQCNTEVDNLKLDIYISQLTFRYLFVQLLCFVCSIYVYVEKQ